MLIRAGRWSARVVCAMAVASGVSAGEPLAEEPGPVDFNRDIRPILARNCLLCHGQATTEQERRAADGCSDDGGTGSDPRREADEQAHNHNQANPAVEP